MKKIIRFTLLSLLVLMYQLSFGQMMIMQGQWKGRIIKDNKEWNTELNFYLSEHELKGDFNLPDYGLYHLVFSIVQIKDSIVHFEYIDKNSKAIFKGILNDRNISGDWEGLGINATFSIKKLSNTSVQFNTEEVSFINADAKLSGTLILPIGKGPFPAIIQVHGSGNQTRGEDFYKSRAYLFARNGIAVLIYDRRGKGASTGTNVSMELLADDAIAGVHFLQQHASIQKNKIGIMGFSQGGYVGPLAASRSDDIVFIIAGSAPGITPDEQNDFDVEHQLISRKVSEDSIAYVLNFRKDLRNYQYNNSGDKNELDGRLSEIRSKSWYENTLLPDSVMGPVSAGVKDWLTFNPLPIWKKIKIPKLLIWGELDDAVPAAKSKELIEGVFKESGNKNYLLKVYKNASHGIELINDGKEWDWPRLAEGYHQTLVDWVKNITSK
ncbi:MAG: alpha/beta fold hydrolase [Bacteroidota bacterium]